jgi:hypothetical protein
MRFGAGCLLGRTVRPAHLIPRQSRAVQSGGRLERQVLYQKARY